MTLHDVWVGCFENSLAVDGSKTQRDSGPLDDKLEARWDVLQGDPYSECAQKGGESPRGESGDEYRGV